MGMYCLRSDTEGMVHVALPNLPSRRKNSVVPLAMRPEVMQIELMQKIGVEQCAIDPMDLTVENLRQNEI